MPASGDLRNVVKTFADLPATSTNQIEVTLNDGMFEIVARNVIILLIALLVEDVEEAIECIIHVWYSALIRKSDMKILQKVVLPEIQEVCNIIEAEPNPEGSLHFRHLQVGKAHLMIDLPEELWFALRDFVQIPKGLTAKRANAIRQSVTLSRDNQDLNDRTRLYQSGGHRLAHARFREDGLLLPFGARRDEFNQPNP